METYKVKVDRIKLVEALQEKITELSRMKASLIAPMCSDVKEISITPELVGMLHLTEVEK